MGSPPSSDELAALPTLRSDGEAPTSEPGAGDRIGRFEVRGVLGRGGMGVVLSARDPQLERDVAIKLVRSSGRDRDDDFRARLLREARAMARLRDPNIISVYEVGEHAGQIYLAMEAIDGDTLRVEIRRRVDAGTAGWREIVALYAAAGRGLAAAHSADMVHRDFKPDNVLVDRGGRVLVGDFGIVGATGARGPQTGEELAFSEQLTRADEVLGTPVYMAPEQHAGEAVDARADQFSFCVALYEALCGRLPFAGNTRETYLAAIARGEIREPPAGRRLPQWLLAVLSRGMSADPDARFPSMEALLVELGAAPGEDGALGAAERMVFVGGLAGFIIAWALAVLGFQPELTYQLHYITDIGFLGLVGVLGWFARDAVARSEFNRRVLAFCVTVAPSLIVLVVGAQLSEIPADIVGALHMLVIGTATLFAVSFFGKPVIPMAVGYFGGFIVAAARPELLVPVLLAAHSIAAITAVAIFRGQPLERS